MDHLKMVVAIAFTAFMAGLMVALGLIVFAGNHVPFGAVVAFLTGLVVAISLSIFSVSRSRKTRQA